MGPNPSQASVSSPSMWMLILRPHEGSIPLSSGDLAEVLGSTTSDNGPAMYGSGEMPMQRFNCNYAGGKGNVYEGGIRVPMLLHWSDGGFTGGLSFDEFVHATDWLPTLYSLRGTISPRSWRWMAEIYSPHCKETTDI